MQQVTIVGTGYVGFSLALLLAQQHKVIAYDIDKHRVDEIKRKISPIKQDNFAKEFFEKNDLDISATTSKHTAYSTSNFIILAVETKYRELEKSSNEYEKYEAKARLDLINKIYKNFDDQLNQKYKVELNQRTIERVKNSF